MKYLKLFVTIVVLTLFVASLTYAGKENGVSTKVDVVGQQVTSSSDWQMKMVRTNLNPLQRVSKLESDIVGPVKSSAAKSINLNSREAKSQFSPTPRIEVTSSDPLAGTYQIPGDFATLGNAVAVLNYVGQSANVTFELTATTYTEYPVVFGNYDGNDTYTVTVQPAAGIATTINFVSSNSDGKGLAFNGAQNVTINGNNAGSSLTLQYSTILGAFPTADAFAATIYITGASEDLGFWDLDIRGQVNNANWFSQTDGRPAVFVWAAQADPAENFGLTFDGCTITGATYGMKFLTDGFNFSAGGVTINQCNFGDAFGDPLAIGILAEYNYLVSFTDNVIDGTYYLSYYWNNLPTEYDIDAVFYDPVVDNVSFLYGFGQSTAMHWLLVDGGDFERNTLRNVEVQTLEGVISYGTRIYSYNWGLGLTAKVYNNKVYNITPNGTSGGIAGIRGPAGYVWHNSVRLTGNNTGGTSTCVNGTTNAYNNALSNEMTGSAAASRATYTASGTFNNNAVQSTSGYYISGQNGKAAAIATGGNAFGTWGNINFDGDLHITTGPSVAEDMGKTGLSLTTDFDGVTRNAIPDAGVYEFSTGTPMAVDVMPAQINPPLSSVPALLAVTPKVLVKNNSNVAAGSFDVLLTINSTTPYSELVNVASLAAQTTTTLTFPSWIPEAGSWTITATTTLAGDGDASNDILARAQAVAAPVNITSEWLWDWNTSDSGWSRAIDWKRSSSFTKLGGPLDGASMVTESPGAGLASTYTEGAYANTQGYSATYPGANLLESPWIALDGMTGDSLYISFSHTMGLEPLWDRSWVQYTTDGTNWNDVGVLNDANGINWYNQSVYANAMLDSANFDWGTAIDRYHLWPNYNSTGRATWGSNADLATDALGRFPGGPSGWVFSQIKLKMADYPNVIHAPVIKFRYVAFADAVNPVPPNGPFAPADFPGWAIDNFRVANTGSSFAGGTITGKVYMDVNGDGAYDGGDSPVASSPVYVSYFGVPVETVMTDVNGDYTYNLSGNGGLPGTYNVQSGETAFGYAEPFSATGIADVSHDGLGGTQTQNLGLFDGSVSGNVFEDVDDNGIDDGAGEPGIEGWTVELHADSVNGALMATTTTDANGDYTINAAPYPTYFVVAVNEDNARQTFPASNGAHPAAVSVGTPNVTGLNFGEWYLGTVNFFASEDLDGDGVRDGAGDETELKNGAFTDLFVYKDGAPFGTFLMGTGNPLQSFNNLDAGEYVFVLDSIPGGWMGTNNVEIPDTVNIVTSGSTSSLYNLYFGLKSINVWKHNDLDGDGTVDAGEPGLAGWTIHVTGQPDGTTDATGKATFTGLGPGSYTVTEDVQSGWKKTKPVAASYSFTALSYGAYPNLDSGFVFANFDLVDVSGVAYRDYNGDGAMNGNDAPMTGVTVSLTGQTDDVTDGSGFSFSGVDNGAKTLTVTAPSGFVVTTAGGADYAFTPSSGSNVNWNFGLFQTSDSSTKYRSFTLDSLQVWAAQKEVKRNFKTPNFPNIQSVYTELFKQAKDSALDPGIIVGKAGQALSAKKVKGYIKPTKGADINTTLYKKGKLSPYLHTAAPHGLDFETGGEKRIVGLKKSLDPTKHNNLLVGNLLALEVAMSMSDFGKTPAGFPDLIYVGAEAAWNGLTVQQLADTAGALATNWEFVSAATFASINAAIAEINADMSGPLDTVSWLAGGKTAKCALNGVKAVTASTVLAPNPGAAPRVKAPYDPLLFATPEAFALQQNYPNPFNPTTNIRFELSNSAVVTLKIYNMLGQEIATLLDAEDYSDGIWEVPFDASNLTSGVYFYRLTAQTTDAETDAVSNITETKKMLFTK